ncbi:Mu-like prophage protein gp29 [Achromobacter xylosoxidans]|uniref:DUF935 domain-containing protein n=1 Tax=Alcaligenes xylosoxydans xylosoxydans TaxID=85698 RepID=UPI0006C7121A|nr:DUF935 domain-containing protein [Achromobacter xylosoxidans]MCH4591367.1 DUF935 domain-containing protein [Achromobacter xylosoxidans]CUI61482.1 Mu-like prophage protein gp29 [Achromobacter xylosoxidans]
MAQIVDQFGRPITNTQLEEPQTARLGHLQSEWENHPTRGLTPPKLAQILQQAETGDITAQHEMFADMEEKDAHLFSVMQTRRLTVSQLDWSIEPPANATSAEQDEAAFVTEVLQGLEMEDILFDMTDAVGHGFSPIELGWDTIEKTRMPVTATFRPQGWFRTPISPGLDRNELRLRDNSADGESLWPFGWIMHTHRSRSGYIARTGLFRVLAWPWLFKNFAVRDLAEFLEIYGLPLRLGTYNPNTSDDKARATLLRAVIGIGHDAAAIVPEGMKIEFKEAAKGESTPFDSMIGLMERSTSKAVLGGTLTSGEGEHGTQALGKVHNELRHDLKKSDARQLATTLTRQLVYPILAVNRGRTSLHRCPRLVLDTQQPEDIKLLSDSLPKLVNMGMRIKTDWAHSKLKIPMAEEKDPILQPIAPSFANGDDAGGLAGLAAMGRRQFAPAQLARLKATPGNPTNTAADAIDSLVEAMLDEWQGKPDPVQKAIQEALDSSTSFEDFQVAVEQRLAAMDATALADLLSRGTLAARLWGNLTNGGRT